MNTLRTRILPLSWILSIPLLGVIYPFLNNPTRGAHSLMTNLDRAIPFIKIFILPYVGWEFFFFFTLIYFSLKDRDTYKKILIIVNISMLLSYVVYFFYQTTVARPVLLGSDFLTQLVRFVYASDAPFNCFPSIHCLTSYLMIRGIRESAAKTPLNTAVIGGSAFAIILSTQFVKQHVLLDVGGAIFLGEMVWRVVSMWNEVKINLWLKKQFSSWMTKGKSAIWWRYI